MTTTIPPVTDMIIGLYGEIKSSKSTFGLEFPDPVIIFDIDQGFDRAIGRVLAKNPDLTVCKVPSSVDLLGPDGQINAEYRANIICRELIEPFVVPGQRLTGYDSLWQRTRREVLQSYNTEWVKSVSIDTGTLLWKIAHTAKLERVRQRAPNRERLIEIEYAEPNDEMREILLGARRSHKNLVMIHHTGPAYGPGYETIQKGKQTVREFNPNMLIGETWAGFRHMGKIADIIVRTTIEIECPECKVTFVDNFPNREKHGPHNVPTKDEATQIPCLSFEFCGFSLKANGVKLQNPSFDMVLNMVNAMRQQI